jgi:hypothetical protein
MIHAVLDALRAVSQDDNRTLYIGAGWSGQLRHAVAAQVLGPTLR